MFVDEGCENSAERFAETQDAEQNSVDGLRFGRKKRTETGGAIDQFRFPVSETQSLISDFLLFADSCVPVTED